MRARLFGALARAAAVALRRLPRERALRELLRLDDFLAVQIDRAAIVHEGGVHPKHRLMRYHDFFVERIGPGERVLDVGCGRGELAHDLAVRSGADVTAIDVDRDYLRFARERFSHPRLRIVEADAATYEPEASFDVVVLSNVLEHLDDREALLRRLVQAARPSRVLIRVPLLTRDWRVAMRRDLGLPYFGDATHRIEYEPDTLAAEVRAAGLAIDELVVNWGELWAVARPLS